MVLHSKGRKQSLTNLSKFIQNLVYLRDMQGEFIMEHCANFLLVSNIKTGVQSIMGIVGLGTIQ